MKLALIALLATAISGCVFVPVEEPQGKAGGGAVLVCHKGKKTMELPREAAGAHMNHGDTYGPC